MISMFIVVSSFVSHEIQVSLNVGQYEMSMNSAKFVLLSVYKCRLNCHDEWVVWYMESVSR